MASVTVLPELMEQLNSLLAEHFDDMDSIYARAENEASQSLGMTSAERITALKKRMFMKYFGIDGEALNSRDYSFINGLRG